MRVTKVTAAARQSWSGVRFALGFGLAGTLAVASLSLNGCRLLDGCHAAGSGLCAIEGEEGAGPAAAATAALAQADPARRPEAALAQPIAPAICGSSFATVPFDEPTVLAGLGGGLFGYYVLGMPLAVAASPLTGPVAALSDNEDILAAPAMLSGIAFGVACALPVAILGFPIRLASGG